MKFLDRYRNKFINVLDNIPYKPEQTSVGRRFGVNFTVTCNPDVINNIHKSGDYTRSYLSRKIVEQNSAVGAMVSDEADRASVKRKEIKKFLNNDVYKRVLDSSLEELDKVLEKSCETDRADVYYCIRRSLHFGFMKEFLGVDYNYELRKGVVESGLHNFKTQESFEKLGILAILRLPLWVKNFFTPQLKQKTESFQRAVELIYDTAEGKPNSWFNHLKQLEKDKVLTRKEVLGELRAIYISADTLAVSLVWSVYRMSIEHEAHTRRLLKSDSYARYCYMESLRLHPPFAMISYDKISKCPFHRPDVYIVSVYQTHRNHLYWEAPNEFRPQRFQKGLSNIKTGSYIPFGGTERACIGIGMSMYLGPRMLKAILKKVKITDFDTPVIKKVGVDVIDNNTFYAKVVKNGSSL